MVDIAGELLIAGIVLLGLAIWFGAFARVLSGRPGLSRILLLFSWSAFGFTVIFGSHLVDLLFHPALPRWFIDGLNWLVAGIMIFGTSCSLAEWPQWVLPGWYRELNAPDNAPTGAKRDP